MNPVQRCRGASLIGAKICLTFLARLFSFLGIPGQKIGERVISRRWFPMYPLLSLNSLLSCCWSACLARLVWAWLAWLSTRVVGRGDECVSSLVLRYILVSTKEGHKGLDARHTRQIDFHIIHTRTHTHTVMPGDRVPREPHTLS